VSGVRESGAAERLPAVSGMPRILEVRTKILKKNDELARELRSGFQAAGVTVVNVVSSPGSGKTALLTETLRRLVAGGVSAAAIVGDLETDNDARRLAASGAPVRQIMTHGLCHLEADMVQAELAAWEQEGLALASLQVLFIENVGNLVCPTSWDLGESLRVVLMSVTEGEDKPLKYPGLFNTADLVVLTKLDLAEACRFDREAALAAIEQVRPGVAVLETSVATGQGLEQWLEKIRPGRGA
jgi:hydrogenase nickel incorporation protein HypB